MTPQKSEQKFSLANIFIQKQIFRNFLREMSRRKHFVKKNRLERNVSFFIHSSPWAKRKALWIDCCSILEMWKIKSPPWALRNCFFLKLPSAPSISKSFRLESWRDWKATMYVERHKNFLLPDLITVNVLMDTRAKIAAKVRYVGRSTVRTEACASNLRPFSPILNPSHQLFSWLSPSPRHVGDSNVKCMCPYGYRGNKCETHEFLDDENGKTTKT